MSGISARQGAHQEAQTLIQTGRPAKSERRTVCPSTVCSSKSGATAPAPNGPLTAAPPGTVTGTGSPTSSSSTREASTAA